jgi:hypothetical protein
MGYEILFLILPLLVYGVYQDLKDAQKSRFPPGKNTFLSRILRPEFDSSTYIFSRRMERKPIKTLT